MEIAASSVYIGDQAFLEATEYQIPTSSSLESMSNLVRSGGEHLKRLYNVSVDEVCNQISNFRDSAVGRKLLGAKHVIDNVTNSDNIRTFTTFEELYGAPLTQLKYLAVAPGIQKYVKKGLVQGYSERFFNRYEDVPLEENPDYQRIYSSMGVEKEDSVEFINYANNYDFDDIEFSTEQKISMINNHEMMKYLLDNDIDCTSEFGDKL